MGKVRNIFAIDASRYTKTAQEKRASFNEAKSIWDDGVMRILAA